jgi:hypothetical protein
MCSTVELASWLGNQEELSFRMRAGDEFRTILSTSVAGDMDFQSSQDISISLMAEFDIAL